ncbi:MAG: DUF4838 domain-containing protein [Candidatus Sumerlaeota bacterium]|nr:DUF4838 domain-containing protein [Candidatus Sumerlaeota bacterium]
MVALWKMLFGCFLPAALILALAAPLPAIEIVKDGKPVAVVVVEGQSAAGEANAAADAPAEAAGAKGRAARKQPVRREPARRQLSAEESAANLLVDWIEKITSARLTIAAQAPADAPTAVPVIYVGKAAVKAGLKLDDIESPSHEGVRIIVEGNRALIAGQNEAATLKAVCRFLEALGCRYFMDGPLGEVYPRTPNLSAPVMNITEKPGLLYRNPKGPSWNVALWKAWNGAGGDVMGHAHAWGRYVSPDLFSQHPEFFALGKDGARKPSGWLCTSNPELRKYFAARVIETIRSGQTNPSLSPTDGTGYCQCPVCKAQDDPNVIEPSSGLMSVSKRYADFFDDVARQVAKEYPKSILSFYCYADYTQPPALGRRLSPNLCAFIAPIRYCRTHEIGNPDCPSRLQQVGMVDGWGKLASHLGYYNYMYNLADGTLPFFKFTACKKEFPYLYERGLAAMTIEVLSNWHIYGPQIYLSLRLAYDPKADAGAIMEDYWTKFYGPAAPHMKTYWMGIDAAQERLKCHSGGFHGLQQIYTPEFLKECETALMRATEAAKTDKTYSERVALHAEGYRSAAEYQEICEAMAHGDFAKAKTVFDGAIARLQALAGKGYANREYATSYLERFLGKILTAGVAATAAPNKVLAVLPEQWRFTHDPQDQGVGNHYQDEKFDDSQWTLASTYRKTLNAQGLDQTTILWYRSSFDLPQSPQSGKMSLFFSEVDGWSEVYVNGKRIAAPPSPVGARGGAKKTAAAVAAAAPTVDGAPATETKEAALSTTQTAQPSREGQAKPRLSFEVDITQAIHPGRNVVSVRVDHSKITELFLGGILRPVLLIQKGS